MTRCATTATSRSATCSTSPSTCTTDRGRPGSTRPCARRSTTSAPTRRRDPARAAVAAHHQRARGRGAGHGGRGRGVHPPRPAASVATAGGHPSPVHRAARGAGAGRSPGDRGRAPAAVPARSRRVPDDADLVVVGNPTNPTGVLHPAATIRALIRPGRLVVVDEAFMDCVPGETESLAGHHDDGLVVIRSLTKHWSIPGIRAGYLLGAAGVVATLHRGQVPWSVSAPAAAAVVACTTHEAAEESRRRAEEIADWRKTLEAGLDELGIDLPPVIGVVRARAGRPRHPPADSGRQASPYAVRTRSRAWTTPGCGSRSARRTRATGCCGRWRRCPRVRRAGTRKPV